MDRRAFVGGLVALAAASWSPAAAWAGDRSSPAQPSRATELTRRPSGLKYADVVVGSGDAAAPGSRVTVDYTGWIALADGSAGKKFDSSLDRSDPFAFALGAGEVIAGWDEGVAGMKVGGVRQLVIPASLGYGARGSPPVIPANATLIFEVKLLAIAAPRHPPDRPQTVSESEYTVLPDGLKYKDLVVGTGDSPAPDGPVTVEYTGWIQGTLVRFDSSLDRDGPLSLRLNQVIKGWTEGLATMKVGGKRQLVIPAALGYGAHGVRGLIPENATLIFEVELVSVG